MSTNQKKISVLSIYPPPQTASYPHFPISGTQVASLAHIEVGEGFEMIQVLI